MSTRRSRPQGRPTTEPRALPASAPSTAIDTRQQQAPAVVQTDGEVNILRKLSDPKIRSAMQTRLGQIFGVDEMIAMVATCLRQSPLLAKCDPLTVVGAVLEVAQVGLRLDRTLGQAYLVPFKNGRRSRSAGRDIYEAQLVLGYRGMITMAEHAERVVAVRAKIVYANDAFEYAEGLEPRLVHRPCDTRDRGKPTHVYAVIHKAGGVAVPYVLPWWRIEDLRDAQVARGNTIWSTNTEEMGLKTAIRRGLKYHPLSPKQQRVANLDELAEEGVEQDLQIIGAQVMDEIGESADTVAQAKQAAVDEAAVPPAALADGDQDDDDDDERTNDGEATPTSSTDQPAAASEDDAGKLSAAEEAAFEADARRGGP